MAIYLHGHSEMVLRAHRGRTAANSAGHLLPLLKPGMSLLDVGCGEGWITRDPARLVAPGQVTGIDTAAEVIGRARAGGAIADNLRFETADLLRLADEFGRFDVVHVHQVLHHLADPLGALRPRPECREAIQNMETSSEMETLVAGVRKSFHIPSVDRSKRPQRPNDRVMWETRGCCNRARSTRRDRPGRCR